MNRIKVIIRRPDEPIGHVEHIDNTLQELQSIVGGYIETVTITTDLVIICNEEGRLIDMPYNCNLFGHDFYGTLIFAGIDGDEFGDYPGDLNHFKKYIIGGALL